MRSALALLLLAASATIQAQAPRSYAYEFRLDPGGKKPGNVIHGTVQVSGGRARIDTDERKREGDEGYFLLSDGGRTVHVVHPGKREYETHDADEFARVVGTALRAVGPVVRIKVEDARLDTTRLGAGGTVAGRATQRVQLNQRWTTSMRVLGFVKTGLGGSSMALYWTDPSLPLMRNPLFDIVSTSLLTLAATDESFMERADAARAALFRGSPLKAEVRTTITEDGGDDVTILRYEVTKITVGPIDESRLMVPKGYNRTTKREVSF